MADFIDGFRRPGPTVGNGWLFRKKDESASPQPWRLANSVARPADASLTTLMYRASPVDAGGTYKWKCYFRWPNDGAYGPTNAAEVFFRYTATGGMGNRRYAIVITGSTGSLIKRQWISGVLTQITVGTWPRTDSTVFDITVVASDTVYSIYDSGFTGPDHLAYQGDDDWAIDASGLGVGSGYLDQVELDDIGVAIPSDFEASICSAKVHVNCTLSWTDPDVALPADNEVREAFYWTNWYVPVDGIPQTFSYGYLDLAASAGGNSNYGDPAPSYAPVGGDQTWVADTNVFANDWKPNYTVGIDTPIRFISDLPLLVTNNPSAIHFSRAFGPATAWAKSFKSDLYMQLENLSGSGVQAFGMVFVPKHGLGKEYGIVCSDRTNPVDTNGFAVLNNRGEIYVRAGGKLFSSHTKLAYGRPVALLVVLDKANNQGRYYLQGLERFSRAFSLTGIDDFTHGLFVGADMHLLDDFAYDTAAAMDIYGMSTWLRVPTDTEIYRWLGKANFYFGITA